MLQSDDKVSGGVVFLHFDLHPFLFAWLPGCHSQKMLSRHVYPYYLQGHDVNGYITGGGAGITMLVQSSSITTSALPPLVGMGT
jgi:sodium-dependent phosphate cotransporter